MHEDVCKILSRQDLEDTPMNRMMLSEVRSIRMVLESFDKKQQEYSVALEKMEHAIFGNGSEGLKTEVAVLQEKVSENKGRPAMVFSIATSAVAVIAAIVAILK